MIIELLNAKWHGEPSVVSAYIQTVKANTPKRRPLAPNPRRSQIKEHNYKFTHRKAVQAVGGVWRVKTEDI